MRYEPDKWLNWWCHVVRKNYYGSVLLYEFKILSSNFSLVWLYNSSVISWHHPIITYYCNFADDSHLCWSRQQPRGQWWWLTTTATTVWSRQQPPLVLERFLGHLTNVQADEWLNTIEQKFHLLRVTEHQKVEYASHQLQGPIGIWWTHFLSSLPTNTQVTWEQFRFAFRGHHIPSGIMRMKSNRVHATHTRDQDSYRVHACIQQLVPICPRICWYRSEEDRKLQGRPWHQVDEKYGQL